MDGFAPVIRFGVFEIYRLIADIANEGSRHNEPPGSIWLVRTL